jgi:hypothetical protein
MGVRLLRFLWHHDLGFARISAALGFLWLSTKVVSRGPGTSTMSCMGVIAWHRRGSNEALTLVP